MDQNRSAPHHCAILAAEGIQGLVSLSLLNADQPAKRHNILHQLQRKPHHRRHPSRPHEELHTVAPVQGPYQDVGQDPHELHSGASTRNESSQMGDRGSQQRPRRRHARLRIQRHELGVSTPSRYCTRQVQPPMNSISQHIGKKEKYSRRKHGHGHRHDTVGQSRSGSNHAGKAAVFAELVRILLVVELVKPLLNVLIHVVIRTICHLLAGLGLEIPLKLR
mmetsp:Transcript_28124/g.62028  ORF Transcript_28124/g.62028 Transcript_28124/m.62028 type:complete len:221 (+) Transcript_28124:823-1485(+)